MDAYTPGGVIGKRPDYADVVYGNYIAIWKFEQEKIKKNMQKVLQ